MKKTSFAGLFSNNRKLNDENKLKKFMVDDETLKLGSNDLQVLGAQSHWCIGSIMRGLPSKNTIVGSSSSDLQGMKIGNLNFGLGPPSVLPTECWHPNTLGKIGSRLGNPITKDSLTMRMERVSNAHILVEVDASRALVDKVEFILSNGVTRKQPVIYEFTPKFCTKCKRFGHLRDSCQSSQPPAAVATSPPIATVKPVAMKKVQPAEWTLLQQRQKSDQKHQHNGPN
ncbi:hypothetical protein Salat_1123100 [Sesamum alatum]|uniref:DUF4283 domain-containing protein n=1 Tax=Sesamum alatum TaxID=300844 RepID=A0AAE1YDS6_9LAMI|nr:hypothetical protein Salat_1123100 [Sesamum alatum]